MSPISQKSNGLSRRSFLKASAAVGAGLALSQLPLVRKLSAQGTGAVQFWDMVWGPSEYIDTSKKVVDAFNKANPGIQVTYQSNPWSGWPQVFTTAVGSGSAPEISTGGGFQPVQFSAQGAILEIDDVFETLKSTKQLDDFMPGTLDGDKYKNHAIGLPWGVAIRVPYYRTDLFKKANVKVPTNWDELRAALKALTSSNSYGIVFAGNNPLGWQEMFSFLHNNGGGLFNKDGQLDVMNTRNVETFTFLSNLVKDGVVHPGSAGFTDADATKAVATGAAAMMILEPGFEERVPDQKPNLEVLPPLSGPHGDKGTLAFVNSIMLYKQGKNPEATKTFLLWWSQNSKQIWTEGHAGPLPARISIAQDDYFQKNRLTKAVLDNYMPIAHGLGTQASGVFPALGDIDGSGILNTLATDILQGVDAKEALTKAETALKQIVKQ